MNIATRTDSSFRSSDLSAAREAWVRTLGAENIRSDTETLQNYARNCSGTSVTALAVLLPGSVAELQAALEIARQYNLPLYPISGGKNWGYGSRSPVTDENVIVDLRRMNRIVEFDRELAYVVIEPGVTQQQLHDFVRKHGSELWSDVTGASPEASVMANILERGFGLSRYGERALHYCGMEVLLADGRVLNTGFGRFEEAACRYLYRWGLGPYLDGLFTQSNLGIVTKIGIWLIPREAASGVYVMQFTDDQHLAQALPVLRDLKLRGLIPAPLHIANDIRVISVLQQYPYEMMNGLTPLSYQAIAELRKRWDVGGWNVLGGVWGSKRMVAATVKELRQALRAVTPVRYYGAGILSWIESSKWLAKFRFFRDAQSKLGILKLLNGTPSSAPLNGVYWRKNSAQHHQTSNTNQPQSRNPDADQAGVIWISPVFPATAKALLDFTAATRRICETFKFETNVTVSLIAERAVCATVGVFFDAAKSTEIAQAKLCKQELLKAYIALGFIPYRVGSNLSDSAAMLFPPQQVYQQVCAQLKQTFDPQQLIAPGRYGIGC